jgi:3-oxoacyl-[acyl-carrier protein] reductase
VVRKDVHMDLGLDGRVYVLTGASRGLGFATAQCLVGEGARVVLAARDAARVQAATERLNSEAAGRPDSPGAARSDTPHSGAASADTPGSGAASAGAAGTGTASAGAAGTGTASAGVSGSDAASAGTASVGAPASGAASAGTPGSGVAAVGPPALGLAADLADPATPERLLDAALATYGRIDGALISVGGPPTGTAVQATDDQWRSAFETVFLGAVRMARAVVARLDTGGAVGLVLSTSARSPLPGLGISNGLRPGLAGVVKDMADELGPRGIRIFGLLPHRIFTDRNRELFAATGDAAAAQAQAEAAIPLRRLGDPEEFGRVAAFLLSPAASYLTGLSVPVDGGALRMP